MRRKRASTWLERRKSWICSWSCWAFVLSAAWSFFSDERERRMRSLCSFATAESFAILETCVLHSSNLFCSEWHEAVNTTKY